MKMIELEVNIEKPEEYHIYLWKLIGLIPPQEKGLKRTSYIVISILCHTLITIGFPLTVVTHVFWCTNFKDICQGIYWSISTVSISARFFSLLTMKPKLVRLMQSAERLNARAEGKSLRLLEESILTGHKLLLNAGMFMLIPCLITILTLTFEPMVLPMSFPLDWQENLYNLWIFRIYQFISTIFMCSEMFIINTYIITYMLYYIGHVKALSARMEILGYDERICPHTNDDELRSCIKDHQAILE